MNNLQSVTIEKHIVPFLNISLHLNGFPLVRHLAVRNNTEQALRQVTVSITSEIPCIEPFSYRIDQLDAGTAIKIPAEQVKINRGYLSRLSETEQAAIHIDVTAAGEKIAGTSTSVAVQPLEHFGGFQALPELIAAYVTPNHPYVYHIKRKAVEILARNNHITAFEGYQSNPERVLQVMSAIYTAIQNEQIIYSSLPPGYEETGQRLRLLDTIQQERFGNCIDLSLLFAACLEAADLNPVLIIVRGHAFTACWLQDDKFPEIVNDDKAAITKRLAKGIRELAAVETTSVCKGSSISFTDALNMGAQQLVEKEDFLLSVDIKRARTSHIRPLPLLQDADGVQLDEAAIEQDRMTGMDSRFDIGKIYTDDLLQDRKPLTRQKLWERKLLDLSLRNNLLNLRMTRNMLQLLDVDIHHLEDMLNDGRSFSILPDERAEALGKYNFFLQPLHTSSPLYQTANEELRYNRLLSCYHREDLDNILSYIHKNARQSIEENGSSTLYLAIGLLKWYDRKTPDQPRFAPVLLLPAELSRRSVNSKFTLKGREEETMINITLLEFLRQEYGLGLDALEQLPEDDKGVDVARVMGTLRRAVMQLKGWDVEEQLVLGNFSFSKLILWKDIVMHQEDMLKNSMVRSLVDGRLSLEHTGSGHTDTDTVPAQDIMLPIPADVSQTEAVLTAQQGQSFILHGPPGTGKSQTITNIIADALYRGKRVLFVAAKKAALDVVHKRLEQIGLAPFSLELHSNKSKKSDVLEQLSRSLETARISSNTDFEQEALRLDTAKKTISDYVNILHQRLPVGWSLYHSITVLEDYPAADFGNNHLPEPVMHRLDAALWQQWNDWLPGFESITRLIAHPLENPLATLVLPAYTATIQEQLAACIQDLLTVLPLYRQQLPLLATALSFPYPLSSKADQDRFLSVAGALKGLPDIHLRLAAYWADKEHYTLFEEWSRHFGKYQAVLKSMLDHYSRDILDADIAATEMQWKQAQQSWLLPRWLKKRKIRQQLSLYRNTPLTQDEEAEQLFVQHRQLRESRQLLQQQRFSAVQPALHTFYKEEQTDLRDINLKATLVQRWSVIMSSFGNQAPAQWLQALAQQHAYSSEAYQAHKPLWDEVMATATAADTAISNYRQISGIAVPDTGDWITGIMEQARQVQGQLPRLKEWMNYMQLKKQATDMHLQWLVNAYEQRLCSVADLNGYFHYTVHASVVRSVVAAHESLSLFNASLFESRIAQYKKIASDFRQLTIQELRVKLAARLPDPAVEAMQSSEIGILQRAIRNRGRGMSIRRLFDQVPTLLPRLAPCMLMSPISAAQYFDVSRPHFDLVIFDEASQLPTCEAVSAIARARQAIVVGDPNQMPPTAFFTTGRMEEEHSETEDLESILDDCLSLSVPSRYLLRHYRSRHESLIAFSNTSYYGNRLLTFPSADDLDRKVRYHHVPGHYDKGRTRTNRFEAEAIVQYIRDHYSDPQQRLLSLGVVTFSQTQQSLVEDKLQALFRNDPALEQLMQEGAEPLFVKNLENVQGDERDIILFSVGYAPDESGRMTMNFGPLNRNGGWRRLNVAVTRARCAMHVFATLRADEIDLNRTAAEGVAGLKAFLQFAEKGQLAIRAGNRGEQQDTRHLSEAIGRRLQEEGLQVRNHIGTSGFKLDIGIVHPEHPQQYILGVVLDGQYYYNARTANDRELVMPSVLKGLGWNIYRVWSMDWYEHADKIVADISEKVKQLLAQPFREETMPPAEPSPPAAAEALNAAPPAAATDKSSNKQRPYIAHALTPVPGASSETIYSLQNRGRIKQQVQMLVDAEAPVSKGWLYKKLLPAWNTARVGAKLDRHLEDIINEMGLKQTQHHQPFYWPPHTDPAALSHYRDNDTEQRSIEDIAPEEIIVALHEAVQHNLSIEEEELLRYLARTFGFAKVGRQIDTLLRYAIDMAQREGKVKRDNGRVKLHS